MNCNAAGLIVEITCKGASGIRKLAKDKYGCRVMQRLLEQCRPEQLLGITNALLEEAIPLSRNIYGNFVMQHLLEHGTEALRLSLVSLLVENVSCVATDIHG